MCIIVSSEEDVAAFKDFVDDLPAAAPPAPPKVESAPKPAAVSPPPSAPPVPPLQPAMPPPPTGAPQIPGAATAPSGKILASPFAKTLAAERGVDLAVGVFY